MNIEQINRIKRNSNNSNVYMKVLKREFLKGKTITDQMNFVEDIAKSHSKEDLDFHENNLKTLSENLISFNKNYFYIVISFFAIIFSVIIMGFSSLAGYINNLSMKLLDETIKNNGDITSLNELFDAFYGISFKGLLIASGFLFAGILLIYFISYTMESNRNNNLVYIKNAKILKEDIIKQMKITSSKD